MRYVDEARKAELEEFSKEDLVMMCLEMEEQIEDLEDEIRCMDEFTEPEVLPLEMDEE